MDAKRFIQLVEEKKKRAVEKKDAPLKWEQKLEAAAEAKSDAEAKERKLKAAKHKRKSVSHSDSDSDGDSSDGGRKSNNRAHKRHRKYAHSNWGSDNEKCKEKKSKKKSRRQSYSSNDDSDDEYERYSDE
ncbi:hypothetical protein I3842_06G014700 [Carya illinoinensis]|uniref:Uncharacterized protein n=1 Tax=Carya illinoinensis TaxID=32201 RepID=A0A922EPE7_CARIL|nr:hypothetical protein I3842_06G014700 [Carya illinoinensis]